MYSPSTEEIDGIIADLRRAGRLTSYVSGDGGLIHHLSDEEARRLLEELEVPRDADELHRELIGAAPGPLFEQMGVRSGWLTAPWRGPGRWVWAAVTLLFWWGLAVLVAFVVLTREAAGSREWNPYALNGVDAPWAWAAIALVAFLAAFYTWYVFHGLRAPAALREEIPRAYGDEEGERSMFEALAAVRLVRADEEARARRTRETEAATVAENRRRGAELAQRFGRRGPVGSAGEGAGGDAGGDTSGGTSGAPR